MMTCSLSRLLLVTVLLIVVTAGEARADSDGYYCVGAGFIAVEFRAFKTHGLIGPHVLRVARFDADFGPRWTGEVVVADFQPHSLACGAKTILFEGAGDHGLLSYVIQLDSAGSPRIVSQSSDTDYAFNAFPTAPENIGNWARPGITRLPSRAQYPRFQLRVTQIDRRVAAGIQHDMKSILEEIDQSGQVRRSLVINEGTSFESSGGDRALTTPDLSLELPSGLSGHGSALRSLPLWYDSLAAHLRRYEATHLIGRHTDDTSYRQLESCAAATWLASPHGRASRSHAGCRS